MDNLLRTEFIKLKRSYMFLISILGTCVAPFMVVVASFISMRTKVPTPNIVFKQLFEEVSLYHMLIIGPPLYGVIIAYLFGREYIEDTLKNLLIIPISRESFLVSKIILLFLWIQTLSVIAWLLTLMLGMLLHFQGLSQSLIIDSFFTFVIGGVLLWILSPPIIILSIYFKNYVPTIVLTIIITLINLMTANSEHRGLFPWAAVGDISRGTLPNTYPFLLSLIIIVVTSIFSVIILFSYFKKTDIS
ncbi:ABC transporter permease [Staphylococcus aureus]